MVALSWVTALLRRRPMRIAGPAAGVALAVSFVGSLGAFLTMARNQMTSGAVRRVPVDWQVEVQPGASNSEVMAALRRRSDVRVALAVGYASTTGLQATTVGTTQTTGPGVVLGLPHGYRAAFPLEIRSLVGRPDGVLLAQQAAANLHAGPGDVVTIGRAGRVPLAVTVDGIVDLPVADSLFQRVGAPAGAQPQAPPDNVVLLPDAPWGQFSADAPATDAVRTQVHVRLDHRLPHDPSVAFSRVTSAGRRLEADLAGAGLVGNNLGAALDAARSDALYAQALFVLLGLPGVLIAALLAHAVTAASRDARRRELALLRTRGASLPQLQRVGLAEAASVGLLGAAAGLALAAGIGQVVFGSSTLGATTTAALEWAAIATATALVITAAAVAIPAHRDARTVSVLASRQLVGHRSAPAALRYGVDLIVLAAGGLVVWATGRAHYHLVLAPEGVPTVSVNYWALSGPLLLWVGLAVFARRVVEGAVGRGRRLIERLLGPLTGGLRGPITATLHRQRRGLATGVVLLTLTAAFAISTAVFNTTYRHQVDVDALLTNGAAVTVTTPPAAPADAVDGRQLAAVAGVAHVEGLQHRFVYVGSDLQDLYGVDPATIGRAAKLQDAYFAGGTAHQLLGRLSRQPDAALVSAETVKDFQLQPGDRLRLRVRDARSGQLVAVEFHYAGVVKEFPTAPTDSFVVANASYIARRTGDSSIATYLVAPAGGVSPRILARRLRPLVGIRGTITDIVDSRRVMGSSLTAVDLKGLTKIELGYALVLAVAATGLVLALGLAQRRRSFAIVAALGARRSQLAAFARAEATVFAVLGGALGAAGGWGLANVLVKVLTGVFDPPPSAVTVPGRFLLAFAFCAIGGVVAAVIVQLRSLRRPLVEMVRDL